MEVTLRARNGDIVVVIRVENRLQQEPRPPRTSWSERRFAEALDPSTALESASATPPGASPVASVRAVR